MRASRIGSIGGGSHGNGSGFGTLEQRLQSLCVNGWAMARVVLYKSWAVRPCGLWACRVTTSIEMSSIWSYLSRQQRDKNVVNLALLLITIYG
tara:strand:+ start:720 stop:998 length:279 start_codon:yes stop_codon:yes gene_type:complete